MSDKPLKAKSNGNGLTATEVGPKPGNFPLGSLESRAAARAVLAGTGRVDPYDRDCMLIYGLGSTMDYSVMYADELRRTDLYKRGQELHEAKCPTMLAHLDSHLQRCTQASLMYEGVHILDHHVDGGPRRREPRPSDVLTYEEVTGRRSFDECLIDEKREAWERHFPGWPFPIRVENGRLFKCLAHPPPGQSDWDEDVSFGPRHRWSSIEREALALRDNPRATRYRNGMPYYPPDHNDPLIMSAVVFVQPRDGKHCVEPLTWTDEDTWPTEIAHVVAEWRNKPDSPLQQRRLETRN